MIPETALHAVRILGVDIANLMTQVAVFKAHFEEMSALALQCDPRSWEHVIVGEGEDTTIQIVLPADQEQVLLQLIHLVQSLG